MIQHRTVADLCRELGVTRQAVWNGVRSGRISAPIRVGPRIFVWFEPEYTRALRQWKASAVRRAAATRSRHIAKAKHRVMGLKARLKVAKALLAELAKKR